MHPHALWTAYICYIVLCYNDNNGEYREVAVRPERIKLALKCSCKAESYRGNVRELGKGGECAG